MDSHKQWKATDRIKLLTIAHALQLIDENGMETFSKYFRGLVTHNASAIFPALNRPAATTGNYPFLQNEMSRISHDIAQASKIAESIEQGNEDLYRDFDLSTFMEHFKLDALEKTILALAFKFGARSDLKTKGTCLMTRV
jgi:CCR4-NOT transcription complex subunit 1